ncbi:MAG: hypothetical protein FWG36_07335 [Oscillospiraceae bacterium]|nr:hypothetical protein [Oscillospiraceae bacterium]
MIIIAYFVRIVKRFAKFFVGAAYMPPAVSIVPRSPYVGCAALGAPLKNGRTNDRPYRL